MRRRKPRRDPRLREDGVEKRTYTWAEALEAILWRARAGWKHPHCMYVLDDGDIYRTGRRSWKDQLTEELGPGPVGALVKENCGKSGNRRHWIVRRCAAAQHRANGDALA